MIQLPSASNTSGTVLGGIAGAAIIASAPAWPFVISVAATLGMTPVGLAGVLAVGVSALANYAVTHYAEVKNLNGLVAAYWPQVQYKYPAGKNGA